MMLKECSTEVPKYQVLNNISNIYTHYKIKLVNLYVMKNKVYQL